nr:HNH endonuclease [Sphingomonas gellani]
MSEPVEHCIWCLKPIRKGSEEHVLPDALGCPPHLVLPVGVCMACNNGLGHVDQALIRQFEIIAFMHGVRRKKGKAPAINMWAPIKGQYVDGKPEIHLNAGPQVVESNGRPLPAASAANGITKVEFETPEIGQQATISFTQEMGREPKLARALLKVALGSVAIYWGLTEARAAKFDAVRAFVRKGIGDFDILMVTGRPGVAQHVSAPMVRPGDALPLVEISLFGATFIVDTDPSQAGLAELRAAFEREGESGWTILPKAA